MHIKRENRADHMSLIHLLLNCFDFVVFVGAVSISRQQQMTFMSIFQHDDISFTRTVLKIRISSFYCIVDRITTGKQPKSGN